MNADEKKKLIEVLGIQSTSGNQFRVFAYLVRQLQRIGCTYYTYNGCLYVTKGKADRYPCIVAHMDTVHDIVEDLTVIEVNGCLTGMNGVTIEQTGIGGDDKVGIFIALQCLQKMDVVKAVFFRDEEIGCHGSADPDTEFFKDCMYVLQCDRQRSADFISSAGGVTLCNKDFMDDIGPILRHYHYKEASGMMTDVMALKEAGIACAMANMSCGYYRPHSRNECVNIADVENCMLMVLEIMMAIDHKYVCEYSPQYAKKGRFFDRYAWMNDGIGHKSCDVYGDNDLVLMGADPEEMCGCCNERVAIEYVSQWHISLCVKCIEDYVDVRDYQP